MVLKKDGGILDFGSRDDYDKLCRIWGQCVFFHFSSWAPKRPTFMLCASRTFVDLTMREAMTTNTISGSNIPIA